MAEHKSLGMTAGWWLPAAAAAALVAWTAAAYKPVSLALVLASLAWFAVSLWSCRALLGRRASWAFVVLAFALGWFAEEMGSRHGWFFGDYHYTDVLGPRLGSVPVVIPLMWFGVCQVGLTMACLIAWRHPVPPAGSGWRRGAVTALLTALLVTAFDLGADPYFVYQLKAWVMVKEGDWFGETVWGFAGWLFVSFTITALFLWLLRLVPTASKAPATLRRAALVPVLIYTGMMAYQVAVGDPVALRVVSFFAMGIPALAAALGWWQWRAAPVASSVDAAPSPAASARPIAWDAMTREADPLADRTVAALVGAWDADGQPPAEGLARLGQATRLMAGWTSNAALANWSPAGPGIDADVVAILRGYLSEAGDVPAWIRPSEVETAETVFMDYGPLSCTLLFCASLPECYLLPGLSEVLHIAGQLEARTEHRIRQTAAMVFPVMMKGGLTRPEGAGIAQVLKVRLIHATIRHLILHGSPTQSHCVPQRERRAGASLNEALLAHGWDTDRQGLPCNQLELAYTLLTFSYVFLNGLRKLGLGLPQEQERAYLHAWNVVGHVLGVRDDLLAHTMEDAAAMFGDLQARARARPADPDVRPPLGRALMDAMAHSIGVPVLRHLPVPMTRWLVGRATANAIGVNQRVGLLTLLLFQGGRLFLLGFDRLVRMVVPDFSITRMVTRVVGYHLLTRFLLDQTRPLGLPEELLNPMKHTVSGWHQDARSPRWVNRLETRLTRKTAGA
ncbi:carotenoid biosynthesis protein [Ramlibacter humi]|uniref:Carotenoid biosynthesis protein n=1 Tax=Ramlibacter humi TaxID=2530451 RepID=A0A4Z0BVK5_9BURK|nr:carotenoid biosynthesis protein [Ramlibacter humi]TFZ02039.1 carotenoid biosynthesis protein [Ramlibacter humi]